MKLTVTFFLNTHMSAQTESVDKSVFEIIGKCQSHGQNSVHYLRYVILSQIMTCNKQFFCIYGYLFQISQKFHTPKKVSISDERVRKVRK